MLNTDEDRQARALLRTAADSIPGGADALTGNLLAGVRARRVRSRRRVRVTMSLGTAIALAGGAVVAVLATTATSVQSAYAAVTAAAATTSSQSFRVTVTMSVPPPPGRPGKALTGSPTETGLFDPAHRVGETTSGGRQTVFADGWEYQRIPLAKDTDDKPWLANRVPAALPVIGFIGALPARAADTATPQSLLGLLKAAHGVQADGPASGPGWTGTKYTFSYRGEHGTVSVDQQRRVRELAVSMPVYYDTLPGSKVPSRTVTARIAVTFGDFGVPVRVTAPPASQVYFEPGS
jgi:hypothetical protein